MPIPTDFLPAERLQHAQILEQARQVGGSPLIAMLDTAPGMVALLNPERQIVFCQTDEDAAGQRGVRPEENWLRMADRGGPLERLLCTRTATPPLHKRQSLHSGGFKSLGACGMLDSSAIRGVVRSQLRGRET